MYLYGVLFELYVFENDTFIWAVKLQKLQTILKWRLLKHAYFLIAFCFQKKRAIFFDSISSPESLQL